MPKHWTTSMMRANARFHLKDAWLPAVAVVLLTNLIHSALRGLPGALMSLSMRLPLGHNILRDRSFWENPNLYMDRIVQRLDSANLMLALLLLSVALLLVLAVALFVQEPLMISLHNWFNRNGESPKAPDIKFFFNHFTSSYGYLVKGALWKNVWLFLWSLIPLLGMGLTIVSLVLLSTAGEQPVGSEGRIDLFYLALVLLIVGYGIIAVGSVLLINRNLAYAQTYFILADNPRFGSKRALDLSKKMMKGQKWHFIGLQLSFIGWIVLISIFTCGLGMIFVQAYMFQTNSELYAKLRYDAVQAGYATMPDFGFTLTG